MKARFLIVCAVVALILQGCIVKSLKPFYKDSDVIFNKALLNSWVDQDSNQWNVQASKEKQNAYEMHWLHHGEKDIVFLAHLFKLNGESYLDFFPLSNNEPERLTIFDLHLMPTHSIAKVDIFTDGEVHIKWFKEEWLRSLFDQNRIKISHETIMDEISKDKNDKSYILTASTDELQKFIIKYGHSDGAFDNSNVTWLRLKRPM